MDRRAFVSTVALGLLAAPLVGAEAQLTVRRPSVGSTREVATRRRSTGTMSVVVALFLGVLAMPAAVDAQPAGKAARVGVLSIGAPPSPEERARVPLGAALRDLGWIAGQNLTFEPRHAAGQPDRLPALVAELVRLRVDVIVTVSNQETLAAKQATASIPIVMLFGAFPVQAGLVASFARPGGNVTGTTVAHVAASKYIELLKEAVPRLARIALLWDPTVPGFALPPTAEKLEVTARKLGLTLASIEVQRPEDVERALGRVAEEQPGALFVVPIGALAAHMQQVIDFAARHRLPAIYPSRPFVEAGGLMSYGYDRNLLVKRAASYIDRILKGAKPADLPVEQPTKLELVINMKTAKDLGLAIPQSLLLRADQVIE
jgi:putative tryptophan/tyrosine transport system substrate-binding protein